MDKNCSSLKDSLLAMFAKEVEVSEVAEGCIITLPLKTLDDRFIDVCVERIPGSGFIRVHDSGKNSAELFAQGIHLTNPEEEALERVARR